MKKNLIIALLVLLVAGLFVSCDGTVDELLFGKEESGTEITIMYDARYAPFAGSKYLAPEWTATKVKISGSTWGDVKTLTVAGVELTVDVDISEGSIVLRTSNEALPLYAGDPEEDILVMPSDGVDSSVIYYIDNT